MCCTDQIWTLEQVKDDNQFSGNVKDMNDAINFRTRGFKNAVSPCRKELRSPNLDPSRFRGTDSIKTTFKKNDDVIIARSRESGKILQFPFRNGYVDEI